MVTYKRKIINKASKHKTQKLGKNTSNKLNKSTNSNVYTKKDYISSDGMLTSVWGPAMWHYLHIMSFNYPNNPTKEDKKYYKDFILNLVHVLPCKYCRTNLCNNLKELPITNSVMKNRNSFSRYVYKLHELVNLMLKKKSSLKYCDVRDRYEHFRARCTEEPEKVSRKVIHKNRKTLKNNTKEKGCKTPLYGVKSKCIINIVPNTRKNKDSIEIDKKCIKHR